MAEILGRRTNCMLQVNTSGSWRNVLRFDPVRRAEIVAGLAGLANALGDDTTWCVQRPDGEREWLHAEDFVARGWLPVTSTEPAPLVDVMVSAYDACERQGVVFMAWRNKHGIWILSGNEEPLSLPVYAYCPVMAPAPVPAGQQVAA